MIRKTFGKKLYNTWLKMIDKCYNKENKSYYWYGGRGIIVCNEWREYEKFKTWSLENKFDITANLFRNNDKENYCPENCFWKSPK